MDIKTYTTQTPLVPDVTITQYPERFYRPCVRIGVTDLQEGDVFVVLSSVQVTQEKYYRVMLGRYLQVGEETAWDNGTTIDRAMTTNIDRFIHHYPFATHGAYTVPSNVPQQLFFQQFMYSVTLDETNWKKNDKLVVDYACMTVVRFRPDNSAPNELVTAMETLSNSVTSLAQRVEALENHHDGPILTFDVTEMPAE